MLRPDGGGGGAWPPRTKFHAHAAVDAVRGGCPGAMFPMATGPLEPVMLVLVASSRIRGNRYSSTFNRTDVC
jgi:hypothetical protein